MKRFLSVILFTLLGMILLLSVVNSAAATSNASVALDQVPLASTLEAYNITGIEGGENPNQKLNLLQLGDGKISSVWDDVPKMDVPAYGDNGKVAALWGENEIYFYIQHDSDMSWVAMQWDSNNNTDPEALTSGAMRGMEANDDLWIFGNARRSKIAGDAFCVGAEGSEDLQTDLLDDLYWERVLVNNSEGATLYTAWEVSRVLITGDTEGHDIGFAYGTNTSLLMASDFNHNVASVDLAKFSMSAEGIAGLEPLPSNNSNNDGEVKVGAFYATQIPIGLGIAAVTFILTFVPLQYILKKEAAT